MKLINYQRPCVTRYGRVFPAFEDELERLFDNSHSAWLPALDVQEDKDKFTVNLEVPGLKREDISVKLEDGNLVISGERKSETVSEGSEVHRQERYYGKFARAISLPSIVKADEVKAVYKDGILSITLPKAEESKPKQIDVSVN